MKILALEQEVLGADTQDFQRLARAEAARVWELYQAGTIREMYFRQDRREAVLVFECANTQECQAVLATLPFVAAGLITFEVLPLVAYPGFARLFSIGEQPTP